MKAHFDPLPVIKGRKTDSTDFNSCLSLPSRVLVKAKLKMTGLNDPDEQEADSVADSIVSVGKIRRSVSSGHTSGGVTMPSSMSDKLASFHGQGSRLSGGLKDMMEGGFGRDFSDVRLHTDSEATALSESISAKAFTYGNDIYFNRGQFDPETKDGQHLIAHELTHVIQKNGRVSRDILSSGNDSIRRMKELESYLGENFIQQETGDWSKRFLVNQGYDRDPNNGKMIVDCDILSSETIRHLENSGIKENALNNRITEMGKNATTKNYGLLEVISGDALKYSYTPIVLPGYHMLMLIKVKRFKQWYLQDGQSVYLIKNANENSIKDKVCGFVYRQWGNDYYRHTSEETGIGRTDIYYGSEHVEDASIYNSSGSDDEFVDVQTVSTSYNPQFEQKNEASPIPNQ